MDYSIESLDEEEIRYTIEQSVNAGRIPPEALQDNMKNILKRLH